METSLNFLLAHCEQILSSLESPQNQNYFLNILETLLPPTNKNDKDNGSSSAHSSSEVSSTRRNRRVHPEWVWPALSKMILVVQSCESEEEINGIFENILPHLKPSLYLKLQQLQTNGDGVIMSASCDDYEDATNRFVSSTDRIADSKVYSSPFNVWSMLKDSQRKVNSICVDDAEITSLFGRRGSGGVSSSPFSMDDKLVDIQKLSSKITDVVSECPKNESSQSTVGSDAVEDHVFRQLLTWISDGESRKLGSEALKLIPRLASMSKAAMARLETDDRKQGGLYFASELSRIENLETLVDVMLYELDFENKVERCRSSLDSIISSARDLRKNEDFCCILDLLLRSSNVLNKQRSSCSGDEEDVISGIRLNAILNIGATPAVNDIAVTFSSASITLLDVVVRHLHDSGRGDHVNFANRFVNNAPEFSLTKWAFECIEGLRWPTSPGNRCLI